MRAYRAGLKFKLTFVTAKSGVIVGICDIYQFLHFFSPGGNLKLSGLFRCQESA